MGNETTVKDLTIGGALATLVIWLVGFYQPELMASLPIGGEAAIAVLFSGIFSWFKKV